MGHIFGKGSINLFIPNKGTNITLAPGTNTSVILAMETVVIGSSYTASDVEDFFEKCEDDSKNPSMEGKVGTTDQNPQVWNLNSPIPCAQILYRFNCKIMI